MKKRYRIFPTDFFPPKENGKTVYMLQARLDQFPFAGKWVWYPLIIEPNQDEVPEQEVEAIFRHFWRGDVEIH